MKGKASSLSAGLRHLVWATGLATAASSLFVGDISAQQGSSGSVGRLNGVIAAFERGEPAFNGESHIMMPDMEHNPFGMDALELRLAALRPAGSAHPTMAPILRIPYEGDQDHKHFIKQLLDAGFMGIVLPHVKTADEVRRFVQAMRYPPQQGSRYPEPVGVRGWSPGGATALWGLTAEEYARKADVWPLNPEGELLAIIMIETVEAVENIEEILSVPGLSAVMIGGSDLSLSYGVGTPAPNSSHPVVLAAIERVARACVAHRKLCGSYQSPDVAARIAQGFRMFTVPRGDYR